jgi:biotin transport system substrate-specific component
MPSRQTSQGALAPTLFNVGRVGREVALVLAGTALLAIAAKVKVPFFPVPMTLQTLAVMVIAATYGMRLGTLTVAAYLLEGALGLPVFTNTPPVIANPAYFLGPTGGFLAGFLVLAAIVGHAVDRGFDRSAPKLIAALLVGDIALFALGFAWLAGFAVLPNGAAGLGMAKAWAGGVAPFVLGDLLKVALTGLAVPAVWSLIATRK